MIRPTYNHTNGLPAIFQYHEPFYIMCGRYTLTKSGKTLQAHFAFMDTEAPHQARYNIAPTQTAPVVISRNNKRECLPMRWGLVPSWAKDEKFGARMINARAETIWGKPSFKESFKTKRCLVPADGFIEWKNTGGGKQPHYITLRNNELFAFAGIWSQWKKGDGLLWTFSIITTDCNALVEPIHPRMPVLLAPENYDGWLDPASEPATLQSLLTPFSADQMQRIEISREINSAKNDRAECLRPTSMHNDLRAGMQRPLFLNE
jgi:putative SOS response-associated peptidase YedK